jgi:hypothetical protein
MRLQILFLCKFIFISSVLLQAQERSLQEKYKEVKPSHKTYSFSVTTGLSVPVEGDRYWNSYWSPSYLVSGTVFWYISNRIGIGMKFGYNNWETNEDNITGRISEMRVSCSPQGSYDYNEAQRSLEYAEWPTNSGNANIIEVIPAIRYIIFSEYNKSSIFLQAGYGYSRYTGKVDYSGYYQIYDSDNGNLLKQYDFTNYKSYGFANNELSLGIGLLAGRIEILPTYNIMYTTGAPTHFVNINMGLGF